MQRTILGFLVTAVAVCLPAAAAAQTSVDAAVRVGGFTMDVATGFGVPPRDVVYLRSRHVADDEIPVVLSIARRARVAPATVLAYRQRGRSWREVSMRFGLGPEVYYVPVPVRSRPPYGWAFGYDARFGRWDQRRHVRSDDWRDGRRDGWRDGRRDGWRDGWRDGRRDGRRDDRRDGRRNGYSRRDRR